VPFVDQSAQTINQFSHAAKQLSNWEIITQSLVFEKIDEQAKI
jgi:hypothetical protein